MAGNIAYNFGGGVFHCTLNNCVSYYNWSPSGTNYDLTSTLNYCCTWPMPAGGVGNFTNAPAFIDLAGGNFRLQSNSPCINAGNNSYVVGSVDLDGRPRIVGGTVDLGAYEFQGPRIGEFIAWLQQYGLATDGSADYVDSDGDGMNNWQEFVAGTDPLDATSALTLSQPSLSTTNVTITWSSVTNRSYFVQRAINLGAAGAFSTLQTNIVGLPGVTSWTDTNAPGGTGFYRVGVQ